MDLFWLGGEGHKDIPLWAHMYLVTKLKVLPEDLSVLRSVQKVGLWDGKLVTFIRIYDPRTNEEAQQVKDFIYLDRYPEIVLYEGYREKENNRVFLESRAVPKPSSQ